MQIKRKNIFDIFQSFLSLLSKIKSDTGKGNILTFALPEKISLGRKTQEDQHVRD